MECREHQDQIVLSLYEELTDLEQAELAAHLKECPHCNDSLNQLNSFHAALADDAGPWNVPSDLLVESRRALANELDRIERKQAWWRLPAFSLVFSPMRLLEWTTLVAVGLAAGVYINSSRPSVPAPASISSSSGPEAVSNLRIVSSDSSTGRVEMVGDLVRPLHFEGNIQDAAAQQLLVGALRDGRNPSSRLSAVEALSSEPDTQQVRNALIRALMEDDNAGVRLKALQSLKPFAGKDKDVQLAFMNVLANDEAAGIRVQAIEALKRLANNDAVARDVQEATKNDDNAYIKLQAIQFVGSRQ